MRTHVLVPCLIAVSWLVLGVTAQAAEPARPIVRAELSADSVLVGEAVRLRITVLGPTWFPKAPVFPSFEIANAIVRLPPNSSRSTSETVDRERWNGVTRNYEIVPLMDAAYVLGGQVVRVTAANPGGQPVVTDLTVPEVTLLARVPKGAEALDPYLAGTRLELKREISGEKTELRAGDALVVRYLAEIDGLPALFLPPLSPAIESRTVSVYSEEPVITEGPLSRRAEKSTLVFNYGGDVVLPGVQLDWWNSASGTVETATIEPLTIPVTGPIRNQEAEEDTEPFDWRAVSMLAIMVLGFVLFVRRWMPLLLKRHREARAERLASEAYAFKRLQQILRTGSADSCYKALLDWLHNLCREYELRSFAQDFGDPELTVAIDELSSRLYSGAESDCSNSDLGSNLARTLTMARKRYLTEQQAVVDGLVPKLNP